jgi:GNAT superfamily N-acetyltransferase
VAQVHANSSHAAYEGVAPAGAQNLPIDRRQAFWADAIEYGEPLLQVALDGDEVIGFVGYDRSRDPRSKPTTGEIWAIYVEPLHWGKGAGLALWDAAREGLIEEGCTEVTLWIPLCNDRALRFAELAGFKRELSSAKTVAVGGVKLEEIRLRRPLG